MSTEEPIFLDHPDPQPARPERRRLAETVVVLLLVVIGVSIYRFGHAPAAPSPEAEAPQEASFAALRQLAAPAEQPADPAVDPADHDSALALVDQVGGETFAQRRDNRFLFFGQGRRLVGYDLIPTSKWRKPIGASRLLAAPPRAIAARHSFAYVALAGETGLHVLAIPNPYPDKPTPDPNPNAADHLFEEVGTIALDGPVVAVAVDPAPKGVVDRLYAVEARGSEPVQHHLTVVDVADPRAPRVLSSTRLPFAAVDIDIPPGGPRDRNVLYLAVQPTDPQGVGGIAVMEDPMTGSAAPELLGFVDGIRSARAIRIGEFAYVVGQPAEFDTPIDGLMQLDLSDPSAPRRMDLNFNQVAASEGPWAPGRTTRFGVLVADTGPFWRPRFALALSNNGRLAETLADGLGATAHLDARVNLASLDVYGDRIYAIWDGGENSGENGGKDRGEDSGENGVMNDETNGGKIGSTIWSLQRPHREVAYTIAETFDAEPLSVHLAVDRDLIFGIDSSRGVLLKYSASDPQVMDSLPPGAAPAFAGGRSMLRVQRVTVDDRGFPYVDLAATAGTAPRGAAPEAPPASPRIAVDGDFGVTLSTTPLLGAAGHTVAGVVKVLDLSRPSLPDAKVLGEIVLTAPNRRLQPIMLSARHQDVWPPYVEPWDIALQDRFAYVATRDSLRVIDIGHATEVGRLDGLHAASDIAIDGGFAYIADAEAGLRVIDISRRALPRLVATLRPRGAVAVALFDGGLAVLDRLGGLSLFRLDRPGELELTSRIEPTEISPERAVHGPPERAVFVNHPAYPATQLAAAGKTVFVAGEGFVWAVRTDAPEIQSAVRDDQLLGAVQSIAAADGLLFVSDRRSGVLVFDHAAGK